MTRFVGTFTKILAWTLRCDTEARAAKLAVEHNGRRGWKDMLEWPGRCRQCGEEIADWSDAGLFNGRWVHKDCFIESRRTPGHETEALPLLRSPVERSGQLELPMMISLLLFHFGLGLAVIGWILITQGRPNAGAIVLAIGIITPLIGVTGVALNIISRRRIEIIRQAIDMQGGWKPGR